MENNLTKELLTKLSTIITDNDVEEDPEGKYNDEGIKFTVVESGDWEINYKDYGSKTTVFKFTDLDLYVEVTENRSGSYYSDYFYDDPDFGFVEPVIVSKVIYSHLEIKE